MATVEIPEAHAWIDQQLELHDTNKPVWELLHEHNTHHFETVNKMKALGLTHEQACRLVYNQAASWLRNA